ncbi:hypothetical protein IE53DRAFT_14180 [Violaceomyces palustris]|uniref:Uncharacterized protein n=1 Tax=Violaceomyces palustris TaxID=1673888 RepID=A0ACD0NLJ8_9BASI|nr:hypothetical protein IE53DRAFT_14180 [Violaceomyces palustris]
MAAIKQQGSPSDDSYIELASDSSQNGNNGAGLPFRSLTISSSAKNQLRIRVPAQPYDAWVAAEVLREEFQGYLQSKPKQDDVVEVEEEEDQVADASKGLSEARVSLAAEFLGFVAARVAGPLKSSSYELGLLQSAWLHFHQEFLGDSQNVHLLASSLDAESRVSVLRSYYDALVQLEASDKVTPSLRQPKLIELAASGSAQIHAVFGGQGTNEVS